MYPDGSADAVGILHRSFAAKSAAQDDKSEGGYFAETHLVFWCLCVRVVCSVILPIS
jgi:hypothetical protein